MKRTEKGPDGDRTRDLRFTRPTPYHLATEPLYSVWVKNNNLNFTELLNLAALDDLSSQTSPVNSKSFE